MGAIRTEDWLQLLEDDTSVGDFFSSKSSIKAITSNNLIKEREGSRKEKDQEFICKDTIETLEQMQQFPR